MPVLKKQRYELFCNGIANGITPTISYIEAGFKPQGAAASAWKLQKRPEIANRIADLQAQIESRANGIADITRTEIAIANKDGQVRAKAERHRALYQIVQERKAYYSDPNNEMVRRFRLQVAGLAANDSQPSSQANLQNLPGLSTGYVAIQMKSMGKKMALELCIDTVLLREIALLEHQIGRMTGFVDAANINIDARTQTQNNLQVNVVKRLIGVDINEI